MYCCGELLTAAARKAPRYDIREGQLPHGKHRTGLGVQHGLISLVLCFLAGIFIIVSFRILQAEGRALVKRIVAAEEPDIGIIVICALHIPVCMVVTSTQTELPTCVLRSSP